MISRSLFILAVTVFVSPVLATLRFTTVVWNNITYGKPHMIQWFDAEGPVSLDLRNGPSTRLRLVKRIMLKDDSPDEIDNHGTFYWTPDAELPLDSYTFEIQDSNGGLTYSPPFDGPLTEEQLADVEANKPFTSTKLVSVTETETELVAATGTVTCARGADAGSITETPEREGSNFISASDCPKTSSMTAGVAAAIGVTSGLALIFLASLIGTCLYTRRQKEEQQKAMAPPLLYQVPPRNDTESVGYQVPRSEGETTELQYR